MGKAIYYDPMLPSPTSKPQDSLDRWVREVIDWHFDPATGSPFWLDFARKAGWDPRRDIRSFADLQRFGEFQDEWLRGGPVQEIRPGDTVWIPAGLEHWHGASPHFGMTHIAFSEAPDGRSVDWLEQVSDDDYNAEQG